MAKFMLIKISLMAEITDACALRDAALKNFDTADITSDDHPDSADWHASEEGQEQRREIATEDNAALRAPGRAWQCRARGADAGPAAPQAPLLI